MYSVFIVNNNNGLVQWNVLLYSCTCVFNLYGYKVAYHNPQGLNKFLPVTLKFLNKFIINL